MSAEMFEGVVEHRRIKLRPDVHPPEGTKVYVVVPGVEAWGQVAVPAGSFDAYRLEVPRPRATRPPSGWSKETRRVLKGGSALRQMGGAVITVELEK